MRELAARAGVGLGTIFQHFNDKSSLVVAAFEEDIESQLKETINTLPGDNLKSQFLHIARKMYTFYASRPNLSKTLIEKVMFPEGEQARRMDEQKTRLYPLLANLVTQAMERGELSKDMDLFTCLLALRSFYATVLLLGLWEETFDVEKALRHLDKLIDQHFKTFLPDASR